MPNCPVDDFTLAQESYEGVTIDRCPHCGGVWLDAGELETIQKTQASDFRGVPDDAMDFVTGAMGMAKAETEKTLSCVKCEDELVKREYSFTSQVIIDNCPKGHGMWLDKDELARLEKFYEEEQDFAAFDEAEILKAMKGGGIKGFFEKLLSR